MIKKLIFLFNQSDKTLSVPLLVSLSSVVLIIATFLILYQKLPPKLPLFYSLPWGQAQLVEKQQFLLMPAVLIMALLINTFIAYHLNQAQYVLRRILMLNLVFISIIIFLTALKILSIFT